jgi:RpiR family transcriptional regulator, carbohydrate utilization regulator
MPGVLIKINSLYKTLPTAERYVADYIIKNPDKMPFQSVSQLAEITKVSIASVSRLAKKLGYDNFKDFKIELAQEAQDNIKAIYQEINPEDSDTEIIEKVFLGNIKSLEDTLKIVKQEELIKAAKAISKASRMVFFGIGSSGNIARDAALRFTLLDMQAEAYSDPQQMVVQAIKMKKEDIAIALSHSGRSKITVDVLKLAGENGATAIGISNYMRSPMHDASRIFLCTSFAENKVKVVALSSRIAQMCLIDTLYLLVAHYKKIVKRAEIFNKYAEEMLRFSVDD